MRITLPVRNAGRRIRSTRIRSRAPAAALSLLLLAALLALVPGSTPAGADTTVTTATLHLECIAMAPVLGPQEAAQDLVIDIEHPTTIPRNTVETIVIEQPPMEIPTEVAGYSLNHIKDVSVTIGVPAQFRITDARLVRDSLTPGSEWADATVSHSGLGDATLSIPGPLLAGRSYQIPQLHIDLRAVGTAGTSGGFLYKSFNLTANASLPLIGNNDIPTNCPAPSPNPPLFEIGVAPGDFSVEPDPVLQVGQIEQPTVVRYGSSQVPGGSNRTINAFGFVTEHLPTVEPGGTLDIVLTPPTKDWTDAYAGGPHSVNTRQMAGHRNLVLELGGPDPSVFEVVSVTSSDPAAMTATHDPVGNRIVLRSPATMNAGTPRSLPSVVITVRGLIDGASYASGMLTFERVGFDLGYQTRTCILICFSWSSTKWANATTQGPAPGGQPIGSQPNETIYFPNTEAGTVLTTFGVANPPGANDDHYVVANNVSGQPMDILANDVAGTFPFDPSTVVIIDEPEHGSLSVNPVSGVVTYTPDYGTLEKEDGFTYAVQDTSGRFTNAASVTIEIVGLYCEAPCSLEQYITVDVDPDALSLSQGSGTTVLDPITLDGSAQTAHGLLNPLTVTDRRGNAAAWNLTGQLESDFRAPDSDLDCPVGDPSFWDFRCIPGDNLGWEPMASVAHEVVPGDVAQVAAGPISSAGLRSAAQSLCGAPATRSGGTFTCGGVLSLGVPASAAAQGYSATITMTLA